MGKYSMALDAGAASSRCILFDRKADRSFFSEIEEEIRSRMLKGWKKAVRCSCGWAEDGICEVQIKNSSKNTAVQAARDT